MSVLLVPTTIMWWLSWATDGGDGAGHVEAKAADEAVGHAAGGFVPFDQGDLADIVGAVHLHQAILDGQFAFQGAGGGLVFDDADDAGCDCVRIWRFGDLQLGCRSRKR